MNSKGHLYTSLLKSGIRIVGAALAIWNRSLDIFAISIICAEGLGICEEFVDQR